jgi:glycosyltransferase involved in cell wall biosynthesis
MNSKIYVNGRFLTQDITGVQRVASEVGLMLQKHYGDKIIFLCPPLTPLKAYPKSFNCLTIGKNQGVFWEQFELPLFLKKNKAKILINFCNTAPLLFARNIIVIHDMAIHYDKKWFSWKFSLYYKFLFYFNLRNAKTIITVSFFSKNEILKFYPKIINQKIEVVYLASFIREENNFNKRDYFLAINSINPRKDVDTIINAFENLDPQHYKLKIVGGQNKKVFGSEMKTNKTNIDYLGSVSDEELVILIKESKALINSSLYEGFGLPPLEAMSLKTPCILSKIKVYEELYNDVAIFFKPGEPKELSAKIIELANRDNYDEICEKSYSLSLKFSWEKTGSEYIRIIEKQINN